MSKTSARVTAVQVPGEEPAEQTSDLLAEQTAEQSSEAPESATNEIQSAPAVDLDAIRAQIRAEEQAKARAELDQSEKAANSAPATRGSYRNMSAADIDPASLTAPVMTKDGWLCPPAPEAAKK